MHRSSSIGERVAATPDQPQQQQPLAKMTVRYPSGRTFDIVGSFFLSSPLRGWLLPSVWQSPTATMILDARAVVSVGGREIYSPRENPRMPPDLAAWMQENPTWARSPLCAAN